MLRGHISLSLISDLSFTCNVFAYFKFHSDWGRVIGKIKQNELDCRDTAPLNSLSSQISFSCPEVHWLQCRKFLHIYKEEVFSSNFVNMITLYFVFQCWKRDLITHYERDTWKATTGQRLLPTCLTGRHVMWRGLSLKIASKVTRMLLKIWSSLDFEFTAVKINLISKLK